MNNWEHTKFLTESVDILPGDPIFLPGPQKIALPGDSVFLPGAKFGPR